MTIRKWKGEYITTRVSFRTYKEFNTKVPSAEYLKRTAEEIWASPGVRRPLHKARWAMPKHKPRKIKDLLG